jgi:hypothetical protein
MRQRSVKNAKSNVDQERRRLVEWARGKDIPEHLLSLINDPDRASQFLIESMVAFCDKLAPEVAKRLRVSLNDFTPHRPVIHLSSAPDVNALLNLRSSETPSLTLYSGLFVFLNYISIS